VPLNCALELCLRNCRDIIIIIIIFFIISHTDARHISARRKEYRIGTLWYKKNTSKRHTMWWLIYHNFVHVDSITPNWSVENKATANNGTTAPLCVITVVVPLYDGELSLCIVHLVGRVVSELPVSASFKSFALGTFVCPVMFLPSRLPSCAQKVIFLSRLSCHVLGRPHNGAVAMLGLGSHCVFSTHPHQTTFNVYKTAVDRRPTTIIISVTTVLVNNDG